MSFSLSSNTLADGKGGNPYRYFFPGALFCSLFWNNCGSINFRATRGSGHLFQSLPLPLEWMTKGLWIMFTCRQERQARGSVIWKVIRVHGEKRRVVYLDSWDHLGKRNLHSTLGWFMACLSFLCWETFLWYFSTFICLPELCLSLLLRCQTFPFAQFSSTCWLFFPW